MTAEEITADENRVAQAAVEAQEQETAKQKNRFKS